MRESGQTEQAVSDDDANADDGTTTLDDAITLEERRVHVEEQKIQIERDKLQIERDKLAFERSWRKVLGAGILAAAVACIVAGVGFFQSRLAEADRAAQADTAQKQQDGLWGARVLELYITHPDEFDPVKSPKSAPQNLRALAAAAPDTMKPILLQGRDRSVWAGQLGAADVYSEVLNAIIEKSSAAAKSLSDTALASTSIYIRYGQGSDGFADRYALELTAEGFWVPTPQHVAESPDVPEVRYYREDQHSVAQELSQDLGKLAPQKPAAIPKLIREEGAPPNGIVEVWIPAGWVAER